MEYALRAAELSFVAACVWLVVKRYSAERVKIVPGDVLLWTLSLFFVAPLALNVIGIEAAYQAYPGLRHGYDDPVVRVLAAVGTFIAVVIAVSVIRRAQRSEQRIRPIRVTRRQRRWWLLASFLPLVTAAVSPDPDAYRTFAASFVLRGFGEPFSDPQSAAAQFSVLVTWATYVSCIAFAVWFSTGSRRPSAWLVAGLVGYMNLWLNGKRHIVAMFVIVIIFSVVSQMTVTRRQIRTGGAAVALGLVAVVGISTWYQSVYRPHLADQGRQLESFLIDFGRQDVLRLALAGHILDIGRPLDYFGQSPVLHLQAAAPGLINDQTITYADRVTSIASEESLREQPGAITTSLISESVDNFGVAGLLVGPLLLSWIALLASYRNDPLLRIIGGLAAATLAVVHVLAVAPIVVWMLGRLCWLAMQRSFAAEYARRGPISQSAPY